MLSRLHGCGVPAGSEVSPKGESFVNVAYLSAFSALAGSAIGGVASIATTWLTQHSQDRFQRHAQSVGRERGCMEISSTERRCCALTP